MSKARRTPELSAPETQPITAPPAQEAVAQGSGDGGDPGSPPAPQESLTPTLDAAGLNTGGGGDDDADPMADKPPEIIIQNHYDVKGDQARTTVGVNETTFFFVNEDGDSWDADGVKGKTDAKGNFVWVAPAAAGSHTITVTIGTRKNKVEMEVVEPDGITGANSQGAAINMVAGKPGASMTLDMIISPDTVAFNDIRWSEVAGPATNLKGYFPAVMNAPSHVPKPESKPSNGNAVADEANFRADVGPPFSGTTPAPWVGGSYDWVIPNVWRVPGGTAKKFAEVTQHAEIKDDKGTSVVTKAGQTSPDRAP